MQVKDGLKIKKVSDYYLVVKDDVNLDFNKVITLNKSGKLLFESLKEPQTTESLTNVLLNTYDVTEEQAIKDVNSFLNILKENNLLKWKENR